MIDRVVVALCVALGLSLVAVAEDDEDTLTSGTFSGLSFRSIGPAVNSGRVTDLAVDPDNPANYYVAAASGGVWKTTNGGITFTPIFDGEGSYSIGCVTLDPKNPHTVWVGTGENNSQRSVSFGDGVYRSRDDGKSWKKMGLGESEHIGMIAIDPRDSSVVYVAAQGPLWRSGGDRGLYKTTDGGETWNRVLEISDDTGVNEVHMDPRNPDVLYASAYQRRRHVWTLIDGGPESAIYKSEDAGKTWRKLSNGLPGADKGRIGLAISPANPDIIYAIIETARDKDGNRGGVYRSTNRGESWEKRSGYMATSPQYYNELVCDPHGPDRLYSLDTRLKVSDDGGKTWRNMPGTKKHVDNHALWLDPDDAGSMLVGCDGGVYESRDGGAHWRYMENLPITQFYKVAIDNDEPFYNIYGGTQDNATLAGPSRTTKRGGISNADWYTTIGGDGFESQVDPTDPNIIYSQSQYGELARFDRRTHEAVTIKPKEKPGEDGYHWNWDSALILSPHDPHRLYFGANILFRSDDRGDSWRPVSGDLTRQLDRNQLEVMGRIQPVNAVAKHDSTSVYGTIVALSESPIVEGLIYVGTDDGLIQVTEDGGEHWRKIDTFPDVPELAYVGCVSASVADADTVYATLDNHKMGDFTPYVLRSTDRGRTWESIAGDLPERHVMYVIRQDHERPDLLFVGTEFGVFFTIDGGQKWIQLTGGIPTIAVRDMEIQRRDGDLVLGTFGRGFYVLDDYSPLRVVSEELLEQPVLFHVRNAWRYAPAWDWAAGGSRGDSYYAASNPPYGAVFTYSLQEKLKTRRERRIEAEKEAAEAAKKAEEEAAKAEEDEAGDQAKAEGADVTEAPAEVEEGGVVEDEEEGEVGGGGGAGGVPYPTLEELRAEDREREPVVFLTVRDDTGEVVRRITGSRDKGLHRVSWDLRYPSTRPIPGGGKGPLALPGTYTVTLESEVDGDVSVLAGPERFDVVPLELASIPVEDRAEVLSFQKRVARLQRAVSASLRVASDADGRIKNIRTAIRRTPTVDQSMLAELDGIEGRLKDILLELSGDPTRSRLNESQPPSINRRVGDIIDDDWNGTAAPTGTQRQQYEYAADAFAGVLERLRQLVEQDLVDLEDRLERAGAPWTPGRRLPDWEKE